MHSGAGCMRKCLRNVYLTLCGLPVTLSFDLLTENLISSYSSQAAGCILSEIPTNGL